MPEIAEVLPCKSGYHYCTGEIELLYWLGPALYALEPGPVVESHEMFHVTNTARLLYPIETWNERTARLVAADCAEHVLHLFQREYPGDLRPRNAIEGAGAGSTGVAFDAAVAASLDPPFDGAAAAGHAAAMLDAMPGDFHAIVSAVAFAARTAAWVAAWTAADDFDDEKWSRDAKHAVRVAGRTARAAEQQWQADRLRAHLDGVIG